MDGSSGLDLALDMTDVQNPDREGTPCIDSRAAQAREFDQKFTGAATKWKCIGYLSIHLSARLPYVVSRLDITPTTTATATAAAVTRSLPPISRLPRSRDQSLLRDLIEPTLDHIAPAKVSATPFEKKRNCKEEEEGTARKRGGRT